MVVACKGVRVISVKPYVRIEHGMKYESLVKSKNLEGNES